MKTKQFVSIFCSHNAGRSIKHFSFLVALTVAMLGSSCKDDPCDGVVCKRGDCVNGVCVCPEGYTGPSCEEEQVPIDMKITAIRIKDFPLTNGTMQWDTGIGQVLPDLEVRIHRPDKNGFVSASSILNAQEGEYDLPLNGPVTIGFPTVEYLFELYDDDSDQPAAGDDDLMESIPFTPYQPGKDFPKTIEIKGPTVVFEIQVEYVFPQP